MTLQDFQNQFQEDILTAPPTSPFHALCKAGKITADERLRIYRENIIDGLAIKLSERLPTIAAIGGQSFAHQLLKKFVRTQPPRSGCLNTYGIDLPAFIAAYDPAKNLPYLPDLVQLDLTICACEDAINDIALSAEDLIFMQQNPQDTHLYLRTSSLPLCFAYDVVALRNYALSETQEAQPLPPIAPQETYILAYRPHLKAEICTISANDYLVLSALKQEKSLDETLQQILTACPDFDFQAFFQTNLARSLFRSLSNKPPHL